MPLQDGESILSTCDACRHPVLAHQHDGCIVSSKMPAGPSETLQDLACRASIDSADILTDSAIPRDWWLRVAAMDLLLKSINDGHALSNAERNKRLKDIEHYIRTGEFDS